MNSNCQSLTKDVSVDLRVKVGSRRASGSYLSYKEKEYE